MLLLEFLYNFVGTILNVGKSWPRIWGDVGGVTALYCFIIRLTTNYTIRGKNNFLGYFYFAVVMWLIWVAKYKAKYKRGLPPQPQQAQGWQREEEKQSSLTSTSRPWQMRYGDPSQNCRMTSHCVITFGMVFLTGGMIWREGWKKLGLRQHW